MGGTISDQGHSLTNFSDLLYVHPCQLHTLLSGEQKLQQHKSKVFPTAE